jgi:hypothetical protein
MAPHSDERIPGSAWADVATGALLLVLCAVGIAMITVGLNIQSDGGWGVAERAPSKQRGVQVVGYPAWQPLDEAGRPLVRVTVDTSRPSSSVAAADDDAEPDGDAVRYSPRPTLRKDWLMSALHRDQRMMRIRRASDSSR